MTREPTQVDAEADEKYQRHVLVYVSRTFALTIPQLPADLRKAVTTAYLLCRLADTIEDEPSLSAAQKLHYLTAFSRVAAGAADAEALARELTPRLSEQTSVHERDLIANMARVMRVCHGLDPRAQKAIGRCVEIMCVGMHHFQRSASVRGLPGLKDMDSYCYHVAGVVGEMLTDLFCTYSPEINAHAAALRRLAPSFGQGLQMTNILKDLWEDRSRGACWLPQEVFARRGFELDLLRARDEQSFCDSLQELIGIAHGHLRHALSFTLLIPSHETGIRRFCSWSIGLALLTLRSIKDNPHFTAGAQVKISRREVMMVTALSNLTVHSDRMLTRLFNYAARDLPLITQPNARGGSELHPPIRQQWEREREASLHSASGS
ncbi:MAG TPA: phytoene/squalene synthase family protein [Steroidobacteraceae bacterium]|nr:phytoene/squalene synthase family protein [Steroidobacteraceae bacterium]